MSLESQGGLLEKLGRGLANLTTSKSFCVVVLLAHVIIKFGCAFGVGVLDGRWTRFKCVGVLHSCQLGEDLILHFVFCLR